MVKTFLETLNDITKKEIQALTEHDVAFLKARKSYLTAEQLEKYESVLETVLEVPNTKVRYGKTHTTNSRGTGTKN